MPLGKYYFCQLPFVITFIPEPEYFQPWMSRIMGGEQGVVNIIADVLEFGRIREEHKKFSDGLHRLRRAVLTLN